MPYQSLPEAPFMFCMSHFVIKSYIGLYRKSYDMIIQCGIAYQYCKIYYRNHCFAQCESSCKMRNLIYSETSASSMQTSPHTDTNKSPTDYEAIEL